MDGLRVHGAYDDGVEEGDDGDDGDDDVDYDGVASGMIQMC